MPVVLLHAGMMGLLSLYRPKRFEMFCGLIGSMIIDVNFFLIFFGYQIHGVFHNYFAALILGAFTVMLVLLFDRPISKLKKVLRYPEKTSLTAMFTAALIGTFSHVFLDSFLYPEMYPLYPYMQNPFYFESVHLPITVAIYAVTAITTFGFILLYDKKYYKSLSWWKNGHD
jgi:hypothetical protein